MNKTQAKETVVSILSDATDSMLSAVAIEFAFAQPEKFIEYYQSVYSHLGPVVNNENEYTWDEETGFMRAGKNEYLDQSAELGTPQEEQYYWEEPEDNFTYDEETGYERVETYDERIRRFAADAQMKADLVEFNSKFDYDAFDENY